ncbi:MAG: PIN domain-containing protein [Actinomycetota bacterium]
MTEFVDSNVLVYSHDSAAGARGETARSLLARLWREQAGAVSVQVLQEFVVVATTKVPSPIDLDTASRIVTAYAAWPTHEPSTDDVVAAIELVRRYRISFWDSMIVRSAARLGCDVLWTEDLNPGQVYDGVRVEDPFAAVG